MIMIKYYYKINAIICVYGYDCYGIHKRAIQSLVFQSECLHCGAIPLGNLSCPGSMTPKQHDSLIHIPGSVASSSIQECVALLPARTGQVVTKLTFIIQRVCSTTNNVFIVSVAKLLKRQRWQCAGQCSSWGNNFNCIFTRYHHRREV